MKISPVAAVLLVGIVACSGGGSGLPPDGYQLAPDGSLPPVFDSRPAVLETSHDWAAADVQIPLAGDCTDPGRSCFPPFICRVNDNTGANACLSPVGDVPPCVGTPPGQLVPFITTWETEIVVHWPMLPGCITTSFDPALKPKQADIAAAVKAWHDVPCSALCLHPPQEMASSPDMDRRERRIHFRLGTPSAPYVPAETMTTYESATGRLYAVEVVVDPQQQGDLTIGDLLSLVGFAVGLSQAVATADSVMIPGTSLTAPGADDTTALCKLYATPGYCID